MHKSLLRSPLLLAAILAAACLIAFGAVLPGEFVVDDLLWAATNPSPITATELAKAFGSWGFRDANVAINGPPVYRPLQAVFHKLIHVAFGNIAWKFHVLSLALHAACGVLLWLLLGRLLPTLDPLMRLLATAAFVLHPAGSEAVLWISAMSELTVTAAMLGVFLVYIRWQDGWTPGRIAGIGVLGLIACLWKETAIALPLLAAAYELSRKPRAKPFPWLSVAALLAATLVFLFLRQRVIGSTTGGQQLIFDPFRAGELVLSHWRFLFIPEAPPFALRPPEIALVSAPTTIAALAVLGGFAWLCRQAGNGGVFSFGLAWVVLALWPAYAVAIVGEGFFNGRQAYVAAAGVAIMVAAVLNSVAAGHRRYALATAAVVVPWMTISTAANALTWTNNIEVYLKAAQVSPSADGPHSGIAGALARGGDVKNAMTHYTEALKRARTPPERGEYLYTMASLQGQSGNTAESNRLLHELIALQPRNSFAWVGLGNNAWAAGRLQEAASRYRRAFEIDPTNYEAASNLAGVLAASGPESANEASSWRIRATALAAKARAKRR